MNDFIAKTANAGNITITEAETLLLSASKRLTKFLRLDETPLEVLNGTTRVRDCAGIVRLSSQLELEIVPKFLANFPNWREDFFLLATLTSSSKILSREHLRAGIGDRGDIASLIGQTIVTMYWENHRHPLRLYTRRQWSEFVFDGDVENENLILPDADGFTQSSLILEKRNPYNATIHSAIGILLPEVRDMSTRQQLLRVLEALSPQDNLRIPPPKRRIPSRHRSWEPLFELACRILDGFGVNFEESRLSAPGFVLKTWQTWQDLVFSALRWGLMEYQVFGQYPHTLGKRHKLRDGQIQTSTLEVRPDVTVQSLNGDGLGLLIDAKYKTRLDRGLRIVESDIYESLAFLTASGNKRILLIYPQEARSEQQELCGTVKKFETVLVGTLEIIGVQVECRGISAIGLREFSDRLATWVSTNT